MLWNKTPSAKRWLEWIQPIVAIGSPLQYFENRNDFDTFRIPVSQETPVTTVSQNGPRSKHFYVFRDHLKVSEIHARGTFFSKVFRRNINTARSASNDSTVSTSITHFYKLSGHYKPSPTSSCNDSATNDARSSPVCRNIILLLYIPQSFLDLNPFGKELINFEFQII